MRLDLSYERSVYACVRVDMCVCMCVCVHISIGVCIPNAVDSKLFRP